MPMHNTNSLLKYVLIPVIVILLLVFVFSSNHSSPKTNFNKFSEKPIKNTASNDSAAESLDTLTAELSSTKQQVMQVTKDNAAIKSQNEILLKKLQGEKDETAISLEAEIDQIKNKLQNSTTSNYVINTGNSAQAITVVSDLTQSTENNKSQNLFGLLGGNKSLLTSVTASSIDKKPKAIPYYTIPANATAIHDRLMTALVGRIPVKGVVTDPYPFKIVFSDDTLAANGLRVPHLKQMIVSGYAEGDLNLLSVRGWVTSLTFIFEDGTISTTTSNDNDIGHFSKENALGYLSDPRGDPFIRGKLITNAPTYLAGNVALGAAQGAASAFAQAQTSSQNSVLGSLTTTVTGSPGKYVLGQAGVSASNEAQQWWHDREEQSFDAIYVPSGEEIVVNFAKEIPIDYNPQGRKIFYVHTKNPDVSDSLD